MLRLAMMAMLAALLPASGAPAQTYPARPMGLKGSE
jgi:hypothetical protein